MKISELLSEKFILTEFRSNNKDEIISEMIDLFQGDERIINLEDVRKCVLDREKVMSTGVGKSFAIPHGKTNSVNDIIAAFGKSDQPINYDALDGNPVQLIFLLVGQDKLMSKYVKLLGRISKLMNNDEFRQKLLAMKSKEEIFKLFEEEEKLYNDV
jgi:mannitol/fructose-specific phosphotransferase system IIA component (Ntr-type)